MILNSGIVFNCRVTGKPSLELDVDDIPQVFQNSAKLNIPIKVNAKGDAKELLFSHLIMSTGIDVICH